jgi:hypothetical protein
MGGEQINQKDNVNSDNHAGEKKSLSEKSQLFLKKYPNLMTGGWVLTGLMYLLVIPAGYFCWIVLIPELWVWTFEGWWHFIPASFGFIMLLCIPIWLTMIGTEMMNILFDASIELENREVDDVRKVARTSEKEAIERFKNTDTGDLLELLKNSRTDLEAYYTIGLNQSRKSFRNSVLAMWLGFLLLLSGIIMYVAPVEQLGIRIPDTANFNFLIIGGAAIIEFIAALFLWVYRSTSAQLNNFYDREMHTHSVVMCFKIASTITDPDESKKAIIEKVLDRNWTYQLPEQTNSKGFRKLLKLGKTK